MKASFSQRLAAVVQVLLFLVPPLLFGVWACLLFRLNLAQELVNLQSPRFHAYTLAAAGFLLGLAILYPLLFQPQSPPPILSFGPLIRKALALLGLLLPAAAYLALPPAFTTPAALLDRVWASASSASPAGRVDPAAVRNFILNSDPHLPLSLSPVDLQIVQSEAELQTVLKDRQVEVLGQWLPMDTPSPDKFRLVRLVMVCCAADARPLGVIIQGEVENPQPRDWYQATGTLNFTDPREKVVLEAESIEPVEAPEEIFLY